MKHLLLLLLLALFAFSAHCKFAKRSPPNSMPSHPRKVIPHNAVSGPASIRFQNYHWNHKPNTPENRELMSHEALTRYYHVKNSHTDFLFDREISRFSGGITRKYKQIYHNIPVDDVSVNVNFAANELRITNIAGTYINDLDTTISTVIPSVPSGHLDTTDPQLVIYRKDLSRGYHGTNHLAWKSTDEEHIVYIDAHTGELLSQLKKHHGALDRYITDYAEVNVRSEGAAPSSSQIINDAYDHTEAFYQMMQDTAGIDSFDDMGSRMVMIMDVPPKSVSNLPCPQNAFSLPNGALAFCDGMDAPYDVIGHEWGHSYTSFVGPQLRYEFESGALNEGFADIFGETFELAKRTDWSVRSDDSCLTSSSPTQRWLIGNDVPLDQFNGALRDMYNPECHNQPRINGGAYAECYPPGTVADNSNDQGGVHYNSGMPNQVYALLVDGGNYNVSTFSGIGLTKAFYIFLATWQSQLTQTSSFSDLATGLITECDNLATAGTDLPDIDTGMPSGEIVQPADCAELNVILSVSGISNFCNGPQTVTPADLFDAEMYPSIGWDPVPPVPATTVSFFFIPIGLDLLNTDFECEFSHDAGNPIPASLSFFETQRAVAECDVPQANGATGITVRLVERVLDVSTGDFDFTYVPIPSISEISPGTYDVEGFEEMMFAGAGLVQYVGCWGFEFVDVYGNDVDCNSIVFGDLQENDYHSIAVDSMSRATATAVPLGIIKNVTDAGSVEVWYSDNSQIYFVADSIAYADNDDSDDDDNASSALHSIFF